MVYFEKLQLLVSVNNSMIVIDLLNSLLLAAYLEERFDKRFDTGNFPIIALIITMMVGTIGLLSVVLVPAGFIFLRFVYAKLWFIIKVVFHSGDWEIGLETLLFFGPCFVWLFIAAG